MASRPDHLGDARPNHRLERGEVVSFGEVDLQAQRVASVSSQERSAQYITFEATT
jgi:hypothetical protein